MKPLEGDKYVSAQFQNSAKVSSSGKGCFPWSVSIMSFPIYFQNSPFTCNKRKQIHYVGEWRKYVLSLFPEVNWTKNKNSSCMLHREAVQHTLVTITVRPTLIVNTSSRSAATNLRWVALAALRVLPSAATEHSHALGVVTTKLDRMGKVPHLLHKKTSMA